MTIDPCSNRGVFATCLIVFFLVVLFAITFKSAQAVENNPSVKSINQSRESVVLRRWLNNSIDDHPSVLAAKSAVDSAGYQVIAADKALYNPELEIDAETAETDSAYIGLSQTIDWGDTRGARTDMAASQRTAARFGFESKRREIADKLLSGLSDYHTSMALNELAKRGEKLMHQSASLAKRRFDAGDLGKVEVDLANLTYAQARFKLADATSQQARATQKLAALTGRVDKNWPQMLTEFPDPEVSSPAKSNPTGPAQTQSLAQTQAQNMGNTVQRLPQMRAITYRVKAAQANVKVQSGQGSANPTIAIRAGKEAQDTLLGLNLSIPLQVRNNFRAEVNSANAEMIQAEREAIDAFRQLKSRLEIAIVTYGLSREAWLAWQQSGADTLSEQITLLERLWKTGELSTTNYLIQLKQALETKASAIEQRGRMWTDWSAWLLASGKVKQWLNSTPASNTSH